MVGKKREIELYNHLRIVAQFKLPCLLRICHVSDFHAPTSNIQGKDSQWRVHTELGR